MPGLFRIRIAGTDKYLYDFNGHVSLKYYKNNGSYYQLECDGCDQTIAICSTQSSTQGVRLQVGGNLAKLTFRANGVVAKFSVHFPCSASFSIVSLSMQYNNFCQYLSFRDFNGDSQACLSDQQNRSLLQFEP